MPRKVTWVVLEKASMLTGISILIHKMKSKRKSRKNKRKSKLDFAYEFEFCASTTPLIGYSHRHRRNRERGDVCSALFSLSCFGMGREERQRFNYSIEGIAGLDEVLSGKEEAMWDSPGGQQGFSTPSVDERAEEFIRMFYHQMRMERRDSF